MIYDVGFSPLAWLLLALAVGLVGLAPRRAAARMRPAWVPARWSLVGGLVFATHSRIAFMWGQTFWGGQFAL